jgi:TPP-dependent pyruvate/acetoin dehydrogenase alpha subunit
MTTKSKESSTTAVPTIQNGFSLISNEKLLQLHATMLKCRMLEEHTRILYKKSKLQRAGAVAIGQEAASVGVILDLGGEDTIAPLPGDVIASFIKGVPLDEIFASLRAPVPAGYASLHVLPACSSLATQLAVATGVALSGKTAKNGKITVACCGDISSLPELSLEAMHFAAVHRLPLLYVGWNSRPDEDIAAKIEPSGFPCIPVDGSDVVAVYRVASEAIAHARRGNGPTLIECRFSLSAAPANEETLNAGDPLLNMEKYLSRKGLFYEQSKLRIAADFSRELDAASKIARKLALPRTY